MVARPVDDAAVRLRELRHEQWADLVLAAVVLAFALAATRIRPDLAVPLFGGGVFVLAAGMRAVWRRWDLVDRLASDGDGRRIPEVAAYAERQAGLSRRSRGRPCPGRAPRRCTGMRRRPH